MGIPSNSTRSPICKQISPWRVLIASCAHTDTQTQKAVTTCVYCSTCTDKKQQARTRHRNRTHRGTGRWCEELHLRMVVGRCAEHHTCHVKCSTGTRAKKERESWASTAQGGAARRLRATIAHSLTLRRNSPEFGWLQIANHQYLLKTLQPTTRISHQLQPQPRSAVPLLQTRQHLPVRAKTTGRYLSFHLLGREVGTQTAQNLTRFRLRHRINSGPPTSIIKITINQ